MTQSERDEYARILWKIRKDRRRKADSPYFFGGLDAR